MYSGQILQASAGADSSANIMGARSIQSQDNGESAEVGYKTFLGHLFDLLEERISGDRYDEGVRQLVGNQVRDGIALADIITGSV